MEPQITMKLSVFFCLLALSLGDEGESACSDPSDVGPCRGYFPRYFFNPASVSCEEFVYGGCGGNDNNFLSLKECQAACLSEVKRQASLVDDCNLPREAGHCEGYFPRYFYNPASGACERFIYGGCQGNANNFLSEQECELACVSQTKRDVTSTPDCSLPSETGPCKAYFPRYFFNTKTGTCEQFIYGGCDGNDNNFLSVEECQQACASRTKRDAADCSLSSETGPCRGYFPRYFYNSATGACEQFVYGGCDGNANNFLSLGECQQACSPVDKRDATDCSLPSEPGLCRGYFPRYFFNVNTQTCEQFIYGGCGGNGNNYLTVEECQTYCLVA